MVHKNRLASNEKVIKHFEKEVSFPHKYIKRVNTSQSEAIILFDFCDATVIEDANQLQEKLDNFQEAQVVKVGNVIRLYPGHNWVGNFSDAKKSPRQFWLQEIAVG